MISSPTLSRKLLERAHWSRTLSGARPLAICCCVLGMDEEALERKSTSATYGVLGARTRHRLRSGERRALFPREVKADA